MDNLDPNLIAHIMPDHNFPRCLGRRRMHNPI